MRDAPATEHTLIWRGIGTAVLHSTRRLGYATPESLTLLVTAPPSAQEQSGIPQLDPDSPLSFGE
jgi:hypothetical protein